MENLKSDHLKLIKKKKDLRVHLKKITREIPSDRSMQASEKACSYLNHTCKNSSLVLSFASFGFEIDLWPFNHTLANEERLVLPVIEDGQELKLYIVKNLEDLTLHPKGMLQPIEKKCPQVPLSAIEMALIPGLGFDRTSKYRLGYGKGYYDRLLANKNGTKAWGIGYREQSIENIPHDAHDIPMDDILLF